MFYSHTKASCTFAILFAFSAAAKAQEPTPPPPPPPAETTPAPTPAPTPTPDPAPAPATPTVDPQAPTTEAAPVAPPLPNAKTAQTAKKGKQEYTGPTTVIQLPPTPILDAEGRQRLDPDGKPMFNPPIFQIRDKKGHPVFDDHNKPVFQTAKDLGYDEKGHKIDVKKEKPPKTTAVNITRGTFTVDGMTGKAALNYDIPDFKYVYFYVPWIGTTIVSNVSFPGSKEEKNAFNDKTLTVQVGEHTLQLYSDAKLLSKKPESAFVAVDRDFKLPTQYPVVGYGPIARAPYDWPGSKIGKNVSGNIIPPPLPENLRPIQLLSACPSGQMRMPGPKPLPGQVAPVQPCVAIEKAIAPKTPTTTPPPAPAPDPNKPQ